MQAHLFISADIIRLIICHAMNSVAIWINASHMGV